MKLLPNIKGHADIQPLSVGEMETLAQEVRQVIIDAVSKNGGHLSPNLGVVELTIALHRVFDFASDKIVWDVGHQCYAHKLLSGRFDQFPTLRQEGGISGFPRREESPADAFNTGHAGTSISAALGFATARDLHRQTHDVLAVIGDGSMTSGLSFEGLNNAGAHKTDLIVILNDNEMSISPNVGALSKHLNRIISGEMYNRLTKDVDVLLSKVPGFGSQMSNLAHLLEDAVKSVIKGLFVPGRHFEDLGFRYFGPIDGHNLPFLIETLESVKKLKGPRLIHVVTKKGKGYVHAEEKSGPFHGTSPFVVSTGKKVAAPALSYTAVFGKTMVELGQVDKRVVGITAAMPDGTGMVEFIEKFPDRAFDVGIAEQHAATFAGALAAEGFRPVVAIYSTFMQRAYDSVVHDVCNMNLPVTFAIDRAGIVGDDGSTHQGVFDLSFMRGVPNMVVMAPKDENELRHMLFTAVNHNGPSCVRYPRGNALGVPLDQRLHELEIGKAELLREGNDLLICAIGNRVPDAVEAARKLEKDGYSIAVINARFAKPVDTALIGAWAKRCGHILTVEENALAGGFGSAVFEELRSAGLGHIPGMALGVPDVFVEHSTQDSARKKFGLDADGIYAKAKELLKVRTELEKFVFEKNKKTELK
ncbi:MAG: 1-deoxy-D-xylulose-5-phosphate synthase [Nitrospinae bacterium]|nr:1-deoxy-D-xylulose-5-phosphate synthase [Nitrospinota bacterium]